MILGLSLCLLFSTMLLITSWIRCEKAKDEYRRLYNKYKVYENFYEKRKNRVGK